MPDFHKQLPGWASVALSGIVYFAMVEASVRVLRLPPLSFSVFWPPAGFGLAAFLSSPKSRWSGLGAVFVVASILSLWRLDSPWPVKLLWPVADVAEMSLGALLIQRAVPGRLTLTSVREVWILVGMGGVLSPMLASLLAAVSVKWLPNSVFWVQWTYWAVGDGLGVLLFTPFFLNLRLPRKTRHRRAWEGLALLAGQVVSVFWLFSARVPTAFRLPLPYLTFFFVLWAALRFGLTGVSSSLALLSVLTAEELIRGHSVAFPSDTLRMDQVLATQAFLAIASVSGLVLAVVLRERARAESGQRLLADVGVMLAEANSRSEAVEGIARKASADWADGCAVLFPHSRVLGAAAGDAFQEARLRDFCDRIASKEETFAVEPRAVLSPMGHSSPKGWWGPSVNEKNAIKSLGANSWIRVSLPRAGSVPGQLFFFSFKGRRFTGRDCQIAEDIAHRMGLALERLRLLKAMEEAVRIRDDFLAIAGHELKTPLTPLSLQLQTLERRVRDGQPVELGSLSKLGRQLRRIVSLINDLLDATRIAAGRLSLQMSPVSVRDIVREVSANYEGEKKNRVHFEGGNGDLKVWGDRVRLEQVLTNLLENAIKYSPQGGDVRVSMLRDGDWVLIEVQDQGIGIPESEQARLFERYFRAQNASLRSYGGLGLGLYISRDIVERHGGSIGVRSVVGRGSTFFVRLPLLGHLDFGTQRPNEGWRREARNPPEDLAGYP